MAFTSSQSDVLNRNLLARSCARAKRFYAKFATKFDDFFAYNILYIIFDAFFDVFFIVKVSQRRRKGYQKSN